MRLWQTVPISNKLVTESQANHGTPCLGSCNAVSIKSLLLLEGNLDEIKNYVEATYAPGEAIPPRLEEAYLLYFRSRNSVPDLSRVSGDVTDRYDAFIARFNELAKKGLDPVQAIRGQYGDTFWYYMVSVQR